MECLSSTDLIDAFKAVHWALIVPQILSFLLGIYFGIVLHPTVIRFIFHQRSILKSKNEECNDA